MGGSVPTSLELARKNLCRSSPTLDAASSIAPGRFGLRQTLSHGIDRGPSCQADPDASHRHPGFPSQRRCCPKRKALARLEETALRRSYFSAQGLLAVGSETAASAALFYNIPRERFRIVTSPIDVKRIELSAQMPWENSSLDLRCKQVIAIGRQSDEKGHRYLIEAMALYQKFVEQGDAPPVVVHLVGDGVLRKELESLTDSLGLRGSVLFHGVQANPYSLLAKSDLMVLPSLYEGLPNVVLEAMLCRVPVLATNTPGGAGELFRRTGLGQLVARCSATEIANAMRRRFSDPDPWLAPLEAARQYILENHSMDRWIGELSDLFESLRRRESH